MNRCEERYIYNFWEIFFHETVSPNANVVRIEYLATALSLLNGGAMPPEYETLRLWGVSRQLVTADNSLINAVLARLQAENPYIYVSPNETLSDLERGAAAVKFYSWLWKTFDYYEMRAALLKHTATELLAQVQGQVITERKEDSDKGTDVAADSDMPISTTFADVLSAPSSVADKMSQLRIANRDYAHKWKDQVDTKEDRYTLPEKIQLALDTWDDMIKEWVDAFMDQFSIAPSDEWED